MQEDGLLENREGVDQTAYLFSSGHYNLQYLRDSLSGLRRPWSVCAGLQTDLGFLCPHAQYGPFSCIAYL